jgi:hypothetical protein
MTIGPTRTHVPTFFPSPYYSPTPTPTFSPDQIISTSQSLYETVSATQTIDIAQEMIPTQFFVSCSPVDTFLSSLSPNGKWYAAVCGDFESDLYLIVQNSTGKRWELNYSDYLDPATYGVIPGVLNPEKWSDDGTELFFSTLSGGMDPEGEQCFVFWPHYSLYRLSLETGEVTDIIKPDIQSSFFFFSFSPDEQFLASNHDGMTIVNLSTGASRLLNVNSPYSFEWSPDGSMLAYSVATCEPGVYPAKKSSVYVYYLGTGKTKKIKTIDGVVIKVVGWQDAEHIRIASQLVVKDEIPRDYSYTRYIYDVVEEKYVIVSSSSLP